MGWAVGGDLIADFPESFAYPIGGSENEFKYFYLQMHYENTDYEKSKNHLNNFNKLFIY